MTTTNPVASKGQIQKINILLRQLGVMEDKDTVVLTYTDQRTTHISEMLASEARELLQWLTNQHPKEKIKKAIIHLGYKCGLLYGETPEDVKMNMAKLDRFLNERGAVKKPINGMDITELKKVHRQFEAMLANYEIGKAAKATKKMLNDLNITTFK